MLQGVCPALRSPSLPINLGPMFTYRGALLGLPVSHSLSVYLWGRMAQRCGHPLVYTRVSALKPPRLGEIFERLQLDFLNVTSPFKAQLLGQLAGIAPAAMRLGCVNLVVRHPKGLVGYNTDPAGVSYMLRDAVEVGVGGCGVGIQPGNPERLFVVLGAGGAAAAVLYVLAQSGRRAIVLSRTRAHAEELAARFGCVGYDYQNAPEIPAQSVLIGCLPPRSAVPEVPWHLFSAVYDSTYAHSPIRPLAERFSLPYTGGYGWLAEQAHEGFRVVYGAMLEMDAEFYVPPASLGGVPVYVGKRDASPSSGNDTVVFWADSDSEFQQIEAYEKAAAR